MGKLRKKMKILSKKVYLEYLLLSIIILLALVLRLYEINIPLADHHSWRQADTAAVARNFIKEGFSFLYPRIDNMAPLYQGELNSGRLFLTEPPIYQTFIFLLYRLFGVNEYLARLVSIAFSLGAIVFLFLLLRELANKWVALLAGLFMAVLPFSIFYSRVILPEPQMLLVTLAMFYFFNRWITGGEWKWWGLALFFTTWALAIKTFPFFLVLPMFYLAWRKWGIELFKQKKLYLLLFLAIIPFVLWRVWVARYPQGVPAYGWLFNLGGIRFRPAFFRWIFAERISKLILGYWGLPLFILGLILKPGKKEGWFFHWWLVSFLAYVTVFASGNVTHDYYQIPFIPIAVVFLAKGAYWLVTPRKDFNQNLSRLLLVVCVLFMFGFSWFEVRGFYLIQGGVDLAGLAVDELTPGDALILTGDSSDATLLYNCNRYGWTGGYASYFPNRSDSVTRVKELGADFYVTTKVVELKSTEFGQYMYRNFSVVKETDQFALFDLSEK